MIPASDRLIADRLACRRGERVLFANLSFSVEPGAGLRVVGPNGVGKTSLLRILAGLLTPNGGGVGFQSHHDIPLAEQSCFLGTKDALKAGMTPREHVDFWLKLEPPHSRNAARDADAILAKLNLTDVTAVPCGWLSTGQRRRVALARLLCGSRQLWLLDEPLNGLDRTAADGLARMAADFMAAGGILVAASHQPIDWPGLATLALDHTQAEAVAP